ncbi:hypothetical protein ACFSQ7_14745 [Paenibacillus rhizoplanae]
MLKKKLFFFMVNCTTLNFFLPVIAEAHPGRTDTNGGHYCRTNCAKWGAKAGETLIFFDNDKVIIDTVASASRKEEIKTLMDDLFED